MPVLGLPGHAEGWGGQGTGCDNPVKLFLEASSLVLCPSFALRITKSPKDPALPIPVVL